MKHALFGIYLILFIICAISPYDRAVWFAENLPIIIIAACIAWASRYHQFSNTSLILMFIFPLLHTIGGHFTFERVPFDFVSNLFGFERNHYDRIAHFSVGLFAYAFCEVLLDKKLITNKILLGVFSICVIFTVASVYEIIEWLYAISADPEAGIAVLGSQGDIWDAQKDMLADGLGAIFATSMFYLFNKKTSQPSKN